MQLRVHASARMQGASWPDPGSPNIRSTPCQAHAGRIEVPGPASACAARDRCSIPGLGRPLREFSTSPSSSACRALATAAQAGRGGRRGLTFRSRSLTSWRPDACAGGRSAQASVTRSGPPVAVRQNLCTAPVSGMAAASTTWRPRPAPVRAQLPLPDRSTHQPETGHRR